MDVKKCDRCGSIYENRNILPLESWVHDVCVKLKVALCLGEIKKHFDLCPDCTEQLRNWLKGSAEHD